ncbi:hypothetical protein [Chryseobacterium mucoviscidosis]|uniref:hypothetical protein n=1 Tax=Chryseobacterium mucoviscidosis TaxID=1945581 RepID=UPI0031D021E8
MMVENGHFYGNFNPFIKKYPSKTSKKTDFINSVIQTNQPSSTLSGSEAHNNQQPSIINHQSSIINHQSQSKSSTINHQPSTINNQPTTTLPLLPLINILRSSFLQKK